MAKLIDAVSPLYRQYLPLCQALGVQLDLDLTNPTREVAQPQELQEVLETYLDHATATLKKRGQITILDHKDALVVSDTSTILTPDQQAELASDTVAVKSRLGFGTTLEITL